MEAERLENADFCAARKTETVRPALLVGPYCLVLPAFVLSLGGCGLLGLLQEDCSGPHVEAPVETLPPIRLALRYLNETQLGVDALTPRQIDYAGDWPQCFGLGGVQGFIRDASPFVATFIHHALTLITEENQEVLGLTDADIEDARKMRIAAVDLMLRFQAGPASPDEGTFGFWPRHRPHWLPGDLLLEGISTRYGEGP